MAKDASFDIVSEVDFQEVDNAFTQATKELTQRYDLKDSGSSLSFDKAEKRVTLLAPSDFIAGQVRDILISKFVKRSVDPKAVTWSGPEAASGGQVRYLGTIQSGLEEDMAKKINKDIKAQKFKAKTQIEGDKIRVTSPSRDTLQEIIAFLREQEYPAPLQFTNYR